MGVAKYPFKRIGRRLRKSEAELERSYGFVEGSVWYPSERFIEEAHEMMLEEYEVTQGTRQAFTCTT